MIQRLDTKHDIKLIEFSRAMGGSVETTYLRGSRESQAGARHITERSAAELRASQHHRM